MSRKQAYRSDAQLLYLVTLKLMLVVNDEALPTESYHYESKLCAFSGLQMHGVTLIYGLMLFLLFQYYKL